MKLYSLHNMYRLSTPDELKEFMQSPGTITQSAQHGGGCHDRILFLFNLRQYGGVAFKAGTTQITHKDVTSDFPRWNRC